MSSLVFDAGDFQRLDRERTLIEQSERVPIEPDVTPEEENPFSWMLDGLLEELARRTNPYRYEGEQYE